MWLSRAVVPKPAMACDLSKILHAPVWLDTANRGHKHAAVAKLLLFHNAVDS